MAVLTFDKVYDDITSAPECVCIGNEPDNTITKFYVEAQKQCNVADTIILSNYDRITWKAKSGLMTSQPIKRLGVKTFPQIGAIGFYELKYENRCLILAPIYTKSNLYSAPVVNMEVLEDTVKINISTSKDVTYDCFRVVVRNGYFAEEYVTYETEIIIPKPTDAGIYSVTAMGYIEERLASRESEILYFTVTGGDTEEVAFLATSAGEVLIFGDTIIAV